MNTEEPKPRKLLDQVRDALRRKHYAYRRAKSLFRLGLDHLRELVLNPSSSESDFRQSLKFLSCT